MRSEIVFGLFRVPLEIHIAILFSASVQIQRQRLVVGHIRLRTEKYTWFELTIHEGKNRQVRRMCEAIGCPVLKLVRIRIGDYALGDLPAGSYTLLADADLRKLLRSGHRGHR